MDELLLHLCDTSTLAKAKKLRFGWLGAFFLVVCCKLPLFFLLVMVVAGLVGLGIRGLAGCAAHVIDRDMAKINGLAKINRLLSQDTIAQIINFFCTLTVCGFTAALTACSAQFKKFEVSHICISSRLLPAPVFSPAI